MTRSLFAFAFLLGACAVVWMAAIFVGSDALALTVTLVIGGVYALGGSELLQFRRVTALLAGALDNLPARVDNLDDWLEQVPASLKNAVQARIEGERVGLPAPVLTPYLVGLLVMLGLLGTFVGMVDTLQGAVVALEGTNELQAIRAGLAAPIQGLGLAFGTSVAGVAASAMLGLMSTLSRRERMLETRRLDHKIATVLRAFSLTHSRRETYRALQSQADSLPAVAQRLDRLADTLALMGERLGENLVANQEALNQSVKGLFTDLAASVEKTLAESVAETSRLSAESSRLAVESIEPILREAVADIQTELRTGTENTQQQLTREAESTYQRLSQAAEDTRQQLGEATANTQRQMRETSESLRDQLTRDAEATQRQLSETSENVLQQLARGAETTQQQLGETSENVLQQLVRSAETTQQQLSETAETTLQQLTRSTENGHHQLTQVVENQLQSLAGRFSQTSEEVAKAWTEGLSAHHSASQAFIDEMVASLQQAARHMNDGWQTSSTKILGEISGLLQSSERLVQKRIDSESAWLDAHSERMSELATILKTQLETLRNEEQGRGEAAVERLNTLETAVAEHLASLGQALEAPMSRLIETASEAPRAAAEVIEHLRSEISKNIEQDNELLEERRSMMADINELSASLRQSAANQQQAIETLVASSSGVLQEIGDKFSEQVSGETAKLTELVALFAGSSAELSSLGEAFGLAVELFRESNNVMVDNLVRIEESLAQAGARSDEQLGYYVAQAREIIDQSILSQQQMLDGLRQLGEQQREAEAVS